MKLMSSCRFLFFRFVIILLLIPFFGMAGCSNNLRTKVRVVSSFDKSQKPTVAVLNFTHEESKKKKKPFVAGLFSNPGASYIIPDILSRELLESGMFNVVDREVIREKLNDPQFSNIESFDDYKALAATFGADAIVVGTFKRFGFLYPTIIPRMMVMFNAEYVDIKSTQTIWYIKIKAQSSKDLDERDLARKQIKSAIEGLKKKLGNHVGKVDGGDERLENPDERSVSPDDAKSKNSTLKSMKQIVKLGSE